MKILLVVNNLAVGGGEVFLVRLAIALKKKNHQVFIFDLNPESPENKLTQELNENGLSVKKYFLKKNTNAVVWKLNGLLRKLGVKDFYNRYYQSKLKKHFKRFLDKQKVEVVNSHTLASDSFLSQMRIPYILTLHGEYEFLWHSSRNTLNEKRVRRQLLHNFATATDIVAVSDKNTSFELLNDYKNKLSKIYVGVEPIEFVTNEMKKDDGSFNYIMVGRGIKEKGWEIGIKAYEKLITKNLANISLTLVYPDSSYMSDMKQKYQGVKGINFYGFHHNPQEFISAHDCLLLPSYSECCPTVVIEALSVGVPSIVTNVGEVENMLGIHSNNASGIVVPFTGATEGVIESFYLAMETMLNNKNAYKNFVQNTPSNFMKFDISAIAENYLDIYSKKIN